MNQPVTLKQSQLRILNLLFKFRFITSDQLANIKQVRSSSLRRSLQTLRQLGYIDRYYNQLAIINRNHAQYYLTKDGLKALVRTTRRTAEEVKILYRNSQASMAFRAECITATDSYIALKHTYGNSFTIYSQTELRNNDLFHKVLPNYYLESEDANYLLEILGGDNPFGFQKRLKSYLEHADSEDWQDTTNQAYPTILIVCRSRSQETLVQKSAKRLLHKAYTAVRILTTTQNALLSQPYIAAIWTEVAEPEELIAL